MVSTVNLSPLSSNKLSKFLCLCVVLGNLTINNSTEKYILRADDNKIQNAIITIENVSLNDRGEYKCIGRNDATDYANGEEASDVSFVRVKGKL